MRACWCACAPAKAKRPIAQYMPDLSLAQGWSGAQSMLAGALLLGVCSRKNKQTHGATDAQTNARWCPPHRQTAPTP